MFGGRSSLEAKTGRFHSGGTSSRNATRYQQAQRVTNLRVWQVGSSGGTAAILCAMAANPSDPELQGEACTALTNLSHNCDRNRRLVVEGGGLVLILDAMQASPRMFDVFPPG